MIGDASRLTLPPKPLPPPDWDITILLATYNGAPFLQPLLASLLGQTGVHWRLAWRDDGSSDRSAAILQDFTAHEAPGRCKQVAEPPGRLGVGRSFHVLAQHAGGAVAFCDQDDVWLPHKLARAGAALATLPGAALYCARQVLTDEALRPIGTSPRLRRRPDFPMALTQNIATGCTIVLNPAAADLLRAAPPPPGALHDWWCLLLVTGAGGQVITDDEAVVLYRQHASNTVGAPRSPLRRAAAALHRGPTIFMTGFRQHVEALLACRHLLTEPSVQTLLRLRATLAAGPLQRLRTLLACPLRRQTPLETALFTLWFLVG